MANQYKNKVIYNGNTVIDISDSTVTPSTVAVGSYFYDASGAKREGTLVVDETYSITKTLTNVSSSADDTKVIAGNSFFTELIPTSGYLINNITVTMGGVDVTSLVFAPGTGTKSITANGTYNADDDNMSGYSSVAVTVPNTYAAGDEGKVVSSGALVSQTSATYSTNDTYDTTLINEVVVNVSGSTETWELINTVTPSQDVALINVNTDSNGNSFSLKKCLVFVSMRSTGTTSNNKKVSIAFSKNGDGANIDLTNCSDLNYANTQTAVAYCESNGTFKRTSWHYPSSTSYVQYNSGKDVTNFVLNSGTITNFAIRPNDSGILFDHNYTTLTIYGVRT